MTAIDAVLAWPDVAGLAHTPLRIKFYQHSYSLIADEVLSSIGTTMARYVVLTAIDNSPGASGVQLAELTFQKPQSLADITSTLVKQGLIERRSGLGRAFGHHLTDEGQAQLTHARSAVTALHRKIFATFDEERLERFLEDLDEITNNLTADYEGLERWPQFRPDVGRGQGRLSRL